MELPMLNNRLFTNLRIFTLLLLFLFLSFYSQNNAQSIRESKPKNLKVLPKDISTDELIDLMKNFTQALGVRCNFCHDDSKGLKFEDIDFAADTKETKEVARKMIQMTRTINNDFLSDVRKMTGANEAHYWGCMSCHNGIKHPEPLRDVIEEEIEENGVPAAVNTYYELRKKYYGSRAYNFDHRELNAVGYKLLGENKIDEAITIFQINADNNPGSANVWDSLGEAYAKKGDNDKAISYYQKSLELNPDNKNAVKMIKLLKNRM
jgi:tetratricopeptide (TPR) repeat protein